MLHEYHSECRGNRCEANACSNRVTACASGHVYQSVGEARYGNVLENALSFAGTLSVHNGSVKLSQ